MKKYHPLGAELNLWYHRRAAELPARLRSRLRDMNPVVLAIWDELSSTQRRYVVTKQIDPAHDPAQLGDQLIGYRTAWADLRDRNIAERNKLNAQHRRRGKVSDSEIRRIASDLSAGKVPPHKQVSEVHRLLKERITRRQVRNRLHALGLRKKGN